MGKAMFTIIVAMAELERSVMRERVVAGLDYIRSNGTKSGRPIGRPAFSSTAIRFATMASPGVRSRPTRFRPFQNPLRF